MIKEGDLVVCINDVFDPRSIEVIPNRPTKGTVYVVREMAFYDAHDKMGVMLVELRNPRIVKGLFGALLEPSFNITRFAPANEVLDSISLVELEEQIA